MIMKAIKFQLIFVALLVLATGVSAQNPYADIEKDSYADVLKFAGQKPSITDFATYYIGEPTPPEEDDGLECGWGCDFRDVWSKYRKHKPLTTTEEWTEKVTVDAKNGYACIELYFAVKDQDYKRDAKMEIWTWPFVIYTLPRVGKDINAVIYDLPGGETKKILVKWNGLTFDVQK